MPNPKSTLGERRLYRSKDSERLHGENVATTYVQSIDAIPPNSSAFDAIDIPICYLYVGAASLSSVEEQ